LRRELTRGDFLDGLTARHSERDGGECVGFVYSIVERYQAYRIKIPIPCICTRL
jgi:hypothetical protein